MFAESAADHAPPARRRSWFRAHGGDLIGLAASCLLVVIAFSPVLFFGRTLSAAGKGAVGTTGGAPFPGQPAADYSPDFRLDQGASTWQFESWVRVNHRGFGDGEVPYWNPYQGAGAPQLANPMTDVLDPLMLAANAHPTLRAIDLAMIFAFLLGAAAMYCFSRVLGLGEVASLTASAVFSLSGFFFLYSNNDFSRSYVFLPILFVLIELALRSKRLLAPFGLALGVAGNIAIGMPEASFFVLGAAFLYALVRLVQQSRDGSSVWVLIARLGAGFGLGALIAAPIVLPFLQYQALSVNTHKVGSRQGTWSDPAWGSLNWLLPFFHGIRGPFNAPGVRGWVGACAAAAALVGLSGRTVTRRVHGWFFLALGGIVVLKIYGFWAVRWIGRLPVAEQVNFPVFAAPLVGFAVAVLAGAGVQVLWTRDLRLRRLLLNTGLAVGVLAVVLRSKDTWHMLVDPQQHPTRQLLGRAALFGTGFLLVVALFVVSIRARRIWTARIIGALFALVIIAELFALAPFSIYAKRADPYRPPRWMALVDQAMAGEPHGRVLGFDLKLFPNTATGLGLYDIRALDALYVERYFRYVKTFIQPTVVDRFVGGPYGSNETEILHYRDNAMFDLLGVRAFVTGQPIDLSQQVAAANGPGHVTLTSLGQLDDAIVYENSAAYPRAWVVHDVHVVDDEDAAFQLLSQRATTGADGTIDEFDPRTEAVVEHAGAREQALDAIRPTDPGCDTTRDSARITDSSLNTVTLRVDASCAGLLVLPDTYFPGWSVRVDGKESTVLPTNGAFRGVAVPAGSSTVVFRFRPTQLGPGLALAALGLIAFASGALVIRARRPAPPGTEVHSGKARPAEAETVGAPSR